MDLFSIFTDYTIKFRNIWSIRPNLLLKFQGDGVQDYGLGLVLLFE